MSIDPITLMTIGRSVAAVSGIVGTIGNMQAASYQSAVAARNAQIADENARRAVEQSQLEQQDWGEEARGQIGQLVASMSASGGRIDSGSSFLRRRGAQELAQRDAGRIREEGRVTADRFRQQQADFTSESQGARRRGRFSLFEGVLNVGSTYLSDSSRIRRGRSALIT